MPAAHAKPDCLPRRESAIIGPLPAREPWWNHILGVLRRAYREFESKLEDAEARPAKSHLVRRAALAQVGPFTLADLAAQFPSASRQLIKKVLAKMKAAGEVRLLGRGRGARWEISEKG